MIVNPSTSSPGNDHRPSCPDDYCKPNRLSQFLATYERLALPLQRKYLGEPYGFFVSHIGSPGRVVHLRQYEGLADREQRRDAMEADPEWKAYRRVALKEDTLADMEDQILKPAPFFTLRQWRFAERHRYRLHLKRTTRHPLCERTQPCVQS